METVKIENRKDILKIGLTDMEGKPILNNKGEVVYWEFDLSDIELPLKWSKIEFDYKKNQRELKEKMIIIDKRQDVKGKYLLSKNEEEKMKALKEFYQKTEVIYDTVLGKGGVKNFLNGRNYYIDMFEDISGAIEQILPKFEVTVKNIEKRIKTKYSKVKENILE